MDMTYFIPRDYHLGLKELGKYDWLALKPHPEDIRRSAMSLNVAAVWPQLSEPTRERTAELLRWFNGSFAVSIFSLSKVFALGPKVFRPSVAQCRAAEQMQLNIQVEDYRQAYPAVVVELPDEYTEERKLPSPVVVYHDAAGRWLATHGGTMVRDMPPQDRSGHEGVVFSTPMSNTGETIEAKLNRLGSDQTPERGEEEMNRWVLAQRVALNCNLFLTQYPTRLSYADPEQVTRWRQLSRKANPHKAERARRLLAGAVQVIEFRQDIKFHDDQEQEPRVHAEGAWSHWEVAPHWRRGHWRRQAFGVGMKERKLVFIKPMLIRADRFVGSLSETSVVYHG